MWRGMEMKAVQGIAEGTAWSPKLSPAQVPLDDSVSMWVVPPNVGWGLLLLPPSPVALSQSTYSDIGLLALEPALYEYCSLQ